MTTTEQKIKCQALKKEIESLGFMVIAQDFDRPWGGFLVIEEAQAQAFSNYFFKGLDVDTLKIGGKLSPKILMVQAKARLSWQYHDRRAEIWQLYKGSAGIIRSNTDIENPMEIYSEGAQIVLAQGERHRLIGLDETAVVAEIWQHTDAHHPSDEEDIVRVQDDFGR
jgi:mannose-6-phosphate isomerase